MQLLWIPGGHADTMWQRQLPTKTDGRGFGLVLSLLFVGVAAGSSTGADLDEMCGHLLMFMLVS